MIGERARGAILYGCAALLLAGGVTWYAGAAPGAPADDRLTRWREEAGRVLPELAALEASDTVTLAPGADEEVAASVGDGEFVVTVFCVGNGGSQVRVRLGEEGTDSGHGLSCTGDRKPDFFSVTTAGDLRMKVTGNDSGPVVFRYTVLRENG